MKIRLDSTFLSTPLWNSDCDTRIVFITMLLSADRKGFVRGSAASIGRLANVQNGLEAMISLDREGFIRMVADGFVITNFDEMAGRRTRKVRWQEFNRLKQARGV